MPHTAAISSWPATSFSVITVGEPMKATLPTSPSSSAQLPILEINEQHVIAQCNWNHHMNYRIVHITCMVQIHDIKLNSPAQSKGFPYSSPALAGHSLQLHLGPCGTYPSAGQV